MSKSNVTQKTLVYGALYIFTVALVASVIYWAPHGNNTYPVLRDFIIFFASVLLTKYFLYMMASPWHAVTVAWAQIKRKNSGVVPSQPRVSVIIPAWNEEVGLLNTVASVLANTYRNFEVVVVNDGSTDKSDARMREFAAAYEQASGNKETPPLFYYYKENGGKGRALNYGLEKSSGSIIVSIDADCTLEPTAISKFVECFEDPQVMAAVGNVKIGNTSTILGTLQYLEFLFSFYFKKADSMLNTIYIIGGAAGAFRRSVFEKVGPYSSKNITEDIDLSVRIQEAGMKIVYAPEVIVYTEGATTMQGLMAQRLRWKQGRFQTFWEHKKLFFSAKPRHNKLLTWLVLPMAIFGDIQLFFEVLFVMFLYVYSLLTHDFSSFISGIIVVSSMFAVQIFEDNSKKKIALLLLAPIGWMLFYITTVVEYRALIKSIAGMMSKRSLKWQKWQRTGVFEGATLTSSALPNLLAQQALRRSTRPTLTVKN